MKLCRRRSAIVGMILCSVLLIEYPLPGQVGPRTVAESTEYAATSRHADVLAFIRELQRLSPLVRVETLCLSTEGREVPLLVIGKPAPATPLGRRNGIPGRSSTSRRISTPVKSRARKPP